MGAIVAVLALSAVPVPTLTIPRDAVRTVARELANLPEGNAADVFCVWHTDDMNEMDIAATKWSVNLAMNRTSGLHTGKLLPGGKVLMFDEPELVKNIAHRLNLIKTLNRAANEGYFHFQERIIVPVRSRKTGKVLRRSEKIVSVYRPDDPEATERLLKLGGKNYILLRADQFNYRILSTAKDQGGGSGGLYYDLQQIEDSDPKGTKNRKTALQKFEKRAGANFKEAFKNGGENRTGTQISGVTEKPRQSVEVGTVIGRGSRRLWLTLDISNDQFKRAKNDPIRNLVKFEKAATEVLWQQPNGLPLMILTDANDNLQKVVPPNVALNKRIHGELQGMWACATCHGPHKFYQPIKNDIRTRLNSGYDFGADLTEDLGLTAEEIRDKIKADYRSDPEPLMDAVRDEVSFATVQLTGHDVPEVAAALEQQTKDYWFSPVTPVKACRELGYEPDRWSDAIRDFLPTLWQYAPLIFDGKEFDRLDANERAAVLLRIIVPDHPPDKITGIPPEDPHIADLKSATSIIRPKFEEVYGDMMLRMLKRLKRVQPEPKVEKQGALKRSHWMVAA